MCLQVSECAIRIYSGAWAHAYVYIHRIAWFVGLYIGRMLTCLELAPTHCNMLLTCSLFATMVSPVPTHAGIEEPTELLQNSQFWLKKFISIITD